MAPDRVEPPELVALLERADRVPARLVLLQRQLKLFDLGHVFKLPRLRLRVGVDDLRTRRVSGVPGMRDKGRRG